MINLNSIKVRCSSIGDLMTDPKAIKDKEAGVLSETSQKLMLDMYAFYIYGRKKMVQTNPMKKGVLVEDNSIMLLSVIDGLIYEKNQVRFENDFVTGSPDIITDTKIIDIKSSYDLSTFLNNYISGVKKAYWWQLQGYMWLTGKREAEIAYVLSDMPESMLQQELYYLLKKMDVISEESPEYIKAAEQLAKNLTFGDIPVSEKVLKQKIVYDSEAVSLIEERVINLRTRLTEFHARRTAA
jgi:hypothetical protein